MPQHFSLQQQPAEADVVRGLALAALRARGQGLQLRGLRRPHLLQLQPRQEDGAHGRGQQEPKVQL